MADQNFLVSGQQRMYESFSARPEACMCSWGIRDAGDDPESCAVIRHLSLRVLKANRDGNTAALSRELERWSDYMVAMFTEYEARCRALGNDPYPQECR